MSLLLRFGLLLACALGALSACRRPPVAPFQVATCVWPGYEPLYLARAQGNLDARRIRLVEMSTNSDTLRALRSGMVSAAALTLDEAFTLVQDGVDLRVVLVLDVSLGADALLARPGILRLEDLKGRRVGFEQGGVSAYLLARALDAAGLGPEDIVGLSTAQLDLEPAYREGRVDAVVIQEPGLTRLQAEGARVLFDSERIPGEIFDVLVVRPEVIRQHPGAVAQLREAWFGALAQVQAHPAEALARMAPRVGLSPAELGAAMKGLHFPDRMEDAALRGGGILDPARRLSRLMQDRHLLSRPVDPAPLFAPLD